MLATTSLSDLNALVPHYLPALPPKPLVSVLIGNYNYAHFVGQSIESVLKQTYTNWELIICDDGSTDHSVRVIEKYTQRDYRIRLMRKSNGGHPSALNTAFAASSGDILCLLDADDLYLPSKLERVVAKCAGLPEAGLIVHRVIRVDQYRRRQGVWPLADLPSGWFGPELLNSGGILAYLPPTSGLVMRREIAQRLFPLRTEHPFVMSPDQNIMRLAPLLTIIGAIPDALAEYRLHDSNMYLRKRLTVRSINEELELSRALWQEQYRLLCEMSPELGRKLAPFESNRDVLLLRYLAARLRRDGSARKSYNAYIEACRRNGQPRWFRFWQSSVYIPDLLFAPAVNVLFGQNKLKQFVAHVRKLA
jgi:glycosyltransferase involved in cell wall biosynthesis